MAVVKQLKYYSNDSIANVNQYIGDGHGSEILMRTNKSLSDGLHQHTEVRGYNVPADLTSASLIEELFRAKYTRYHGGEREATEKHQSLKHLQIIVSWAAGEWVSPETRHTMIKQLINDMIDRGYLILVADHCNTPNIHMHVSICVYAADGQHKLPTSQKALNDLKRAMDHLCVDYELSIIDNEVLRRNEEYAAWFLEVKNTGKITIHPPRKAKDLSLDDAADVGPVENPAKKMWDKPKHPEWDPQTAGRYYYLPPWIDAGTVSCTREMYHPAMDMDHQIVGWGFLVRRRPLELLLEAAHTDGRLCHSLVVLKDSDDKSRTDAITDQLQRIDAGLQLIRRLDLGTMADIDRHIAHVRRNIARRKRQSMKLEHKIRKLREKNDPKAELIELRLATVNQRINDLRKEVEEVLAFRTLCREIRANELWHAYRDVFAPYTPPKVEQQTRKEYIRNHQHDVAQHLGVDMNVVDEEIRTVLGHGKPAVVKRCAAVIADTTIGMAQIMGNIARLCVTINDPYAEHDQIDAVRDQLQLQMDNGSLLRGMLALDTALLRYLDEGLERAERAADVRCTAEDICWHINNAVMQLTTSHSVSTLRIAYGEMALAMQEWDRFLHRQMPHMREHTKIDLGTMLIQPPCPDYTLPLDEQVNYDFDVAIQSYQGQMRRAQVKLDHKIELHYGADPRGKHSKEAKNIDSWWENILSKWSTSEPKEEPDGPKPNGPKQKPDVPKEDPDTPKPEIDKSKLVPDAPEQATDGLDQPVNDAGQKTVTSNQQVNVPEQETVAPGQQVNVPEQETVAPDQPVNDTEQKIDGTKQATDAPNCPAAETQPKKPGLNDIVAQAEKRAGKAQRKPLRNKDTLSR